MSPRHARPIAISSVDRARARSRSRPTDRDRPMATDRSRSVPMATDRMPRRGGETARARSRRRRASCMAPGGGTRRRRRWSVALVALALLGVGASTRRGDRRDDDARPRARRTSGTLDEADGRAWDGRSSDVRGEHASEGRETNALDSLLSPRGGLVHVSYVSDGFHQFARNWLQLLRDARAKRDERSNVVMLALDESTDRYCEKYAMPCFGSAELRYSGGVMATGGTALHRESAQREASSVAEAAKALRSIKTLEMKLLLDILERGHDVLVSDADVAWLRDPEDWVREELRDVDVAASTDCLNVRVDDDGGCMGAAANTGILYFRPTAAAKKFLQAWISGMETATDEMTERDQEIFNNLLIPEETSEEKTSERRSSVHVRNLAGGVHLASLPMRYFASGHTYFAEQLHKHEGSKQQPFCVHATFQFSQVHGKRQRFREHGLWRIEDDDYYTQGNFIAMQDELPNVWNATGVHNHLLAAAWYRASVRNLLALGRVLKRTVILPRITCMCDRYWGHVLPSCKIGFIDPPFVGCPQDHIMNLPAMEKGGADFREWSFLSNPRTPHSVKSSIATVSIGSRSSDAKYSLEPFPSDVEVISRLSAAPERVLFVDGALTSFCAFDSSTSSPPAKTFDSDMEIALKAESWFCGPEDSNGLKCAIGFPVPKPTASLRPKCAALRSKAHELNRRPHELLSTFFDAYGSDDKKNTFLIPEDDNSADVDAAAIDESVEANPFAAEVETR